MNMGTIVYSDQDYQIEKIEPTLFKPFPIPLEKYSFMRRIRFLIEYFYGYSLYYLKNEKEYIGFCVISKGVNKRYWFANEKDIIVGPYFIDENYRGKKLSELLIRETLKYLNGSFDKAYDYIKTDNYPSLHATEKVGFKKEFGVSISSFTRRLKKSEDPEYYVYGFTPGMTESDE